MATIATHAVARPGWRALLPLPFMGALFALSFLQRFDTTPALLYSVRGVVALLAAWYAVVIVRAWRRGIELRVERNIVTTHYVQAIVHTSIYAYWSTAWPFIGGQVPIIVAQILFAYSASILASWSRDDKFRFGFGQIPVILSTNFFMCFRDEWFFFQFAMIALGVFGKEFIRWNRDGQNVHVFNPSAFGLSIFSLGLLLTGSTGITWGESIAIDLGRPDYIFLWLFGCGLIVQSLFRVTLVTMMAAGTLFALNLAYTGATGTYWFLDSGIPVAVFLGLHLLITDPVTSPRSSFGKAVFGVGYGGLVFVLYWLLGALDSPQFYDKLLPVPILNLLAPLIDRFSAAVSRSAAARVQPFAWLGSLNVYAENFVHMAVWIALFATMYSSHFLGKTHPGRSVAFWEQACTEGRRNACRDLVHIEWDDCRDGDMAVCLRLAETRSPRELPGLPPDLALRSLAHACDGGVSPACADLAGRLDAGARTRFEARCTGHDGESCHILGMSALMGLGRAVDREAAIDAFRRGCERRFAASCDVVGQFHRYGVGVPKDERAARRSFGRACALGHLESCRTLARALATGERGQPADERRALALLDRACRLGLPGACGMS